MIKTKLIIYTLLLFTLFANSQSKVIDSLLVALKNKRSDIDKIKILNHLADEYKNSNPKQTIYYATKALKLSKKIDYKIEQGSAYNNLGNANIMIGNYLQALDNFSKAQLVFENELAVSSLDDKVEIKNGLARAYGSIGFVFMEQSNYAKALRFNYKALQIYEETKNNDKLAKIYNNIGVIYKSQNELFKALVYYEKCLKIQEKTHDKNIGITNNNIGLVYLYQKDYVKSLEYFKRAKKFFDMFSNPRGLGELYNNLGLYYHDVKNPKLAIEYLKNALVQFKSIDDKFGSADSYGTLGSIYAEQKQYGLAIECIEKSLAIGKELGVLDRVQASEKELSGIYEKLGRTEEALAHYKLYSIAKDSVTNAETIKNSIRTEMNFEFERKTIKQHEEQEKKELLFEEQKKTNQLKMFLLFFLSLLLSAIAFLIYNRKQLKKTLTLEKEIAVYEQKALHLQMNPHFIFNCLGSISSFIVQNSTEAAIKYLSKFSKLMRLTLEYSKESLIPIDKEIESLQNYLELEQLRFNNKFDFTIKKSDDIEDDVALPPLLLQPFVENAVIHGLNPKVKTGTITINFSIKEDSLICVIMDNGIGIDKSKELKKTLVSMHKSMALDITRKRLEMMQDATSKKADVTIEEINENGEIKGTKVVLSLPLQFLTNI